MKNQAFPRRKSQAGSVFVLIFIMIALFAALSFALSKSFTGGTATITKETGRLNAGEMIDYGRRMQAAAKSLIINGCDPSQISFETANLTGYHNPRSPTDESCHIFSSKGGAMPFEPQDTLTFAQYDFVRLEATGAYYQIPKVGMFFYVTADQCKQLNTMLDLPFPPAGDWFDPDDRWTGTDDSNGNALPDDGGDASPFYNKAVACLSDGPKYFYYYTLFP